MDIAKVSVIMASYNHDKYVGRAIESVIKQTYSNWEMIIIDDCSNDSSVQIIQQYKDERITFYQAKENQGTICTFNELLKRARGEYIAILGSDDMWYPDKLQKQIEYLENNNEIAVCFSHADIIDEDEKMYLQDEECDMNVNTFNQVNRTQGEIFRYFFVNGNYFCHPSSVVRRSVVEEIGRFDLRFRQLHDYYYWIKILQKYPVYIIQEPLVKYRRVRKCNNSVSAGTRQNDIRLLNEIQIITYEMILNMSMEVFEDAFGDLITKEIENEIQLICAKFFVLLQWEIWGYNSRLNAIKFIDEYINDERIVECLEEEYQYSLKDYYDEKAKVYKVYPITYYEEYDQLYQECCKKQGIIREQQELLVKQNSELEKMRNTISWKVTKPLRIIRKLGRKNGH